MKCTLHQKILTSHFFSYQTVPDNVYMKDETCENELMDSSKKFSSKIIAILKPARVNYYFQLTNPIRPRPDQRADIPTE